MSRDTKSTTSHNVIRKWAESRCGRPATVKATGSMKTPGILRIDFPGYGGMTELQEISWEAFFKKFDEENLAMIYQDKTASGNPSRFCKFVSRTSNKSAKSPSRRKAAAMG